MNFSTGFLLGVMSMTAGLAGHLSTARAYQSDLGLWAPARAARWRAEFAKWWEGHALPEGFDPGEIDWGRIEAAVDQQLGL